MTDRELSLGGRGLHRIGIGTNRLTDTPDNRSFLSAAVGAGVNFVDTAHLYTQGESESTIGAALAPYAEDLLVATKGGYNGGGPERLRAELEQSFERLQTETIGLYYLHRVDPETPLEQSMAVLAEYRDAGRIADLGLSEVSVEEIERARAVAPIAAVQNEYSLGERKHDQVVDFCAEQEIVFVPFFPLAGGDDARLDEIAARHGVSSEQITLAWLLKRSPAILPIPGTLSLEHLKENLAAIEIELTDQEFAELSGAGSSPG